MEQKLGHGLGEM